MDFGTEQKLHSSCPPGGSLTPHEGSGGGAGGVGGAGGGVGGAGGALAARCSSSSPSASVDASSGSRSIGAGSASFSASADIMGGMGPGGGGLLAPLRRKPSEPRCGTARGAGAAAPGTGGGGGAGDGGGGGGGGVGEGGGGGGGGAGAPVSSSQADSSLISSSGSYKTSDLVASIKDLGVDCFDIASAAESQRLLGRGAFGTAWLMRMRHTGKLVVAKEVRVDGLSARQGAQIVREVRNLSSLQHPYICDFIGVYARGGAEGATLGLLLKYAAGGTLEEFIADLRKPSTSTSGTSTSTPAGSSGAPGPTLPPGPARIDSERIARWVSQLATGLAFMHSCGVLHRDIATKNIFLATSSELSKVMLGDLGLSKDTKPGDSKGHSAGVASTLCGTPKYFSPELLSNSMYGQPVCGEDAQTLI